MSEYLTSKQIWQATGIKPRSLKNARTRKHLKKIKWSPGRRIPYFNLEEVREVFAMAK